MKDFCHRQGVWLADLLLALLLIAHIGLLVEGPDKVVEVLSKLPGPVATLVAGIVGLGTIAWQTKIGFRNLIASQEHRAEIEERARKHQAELAAQQRAADLKRDRRILATALRGELVAIFGTIKDTRKYYIIQAEVYRHFPDRKGKIMWFNIKAPLYEKMIDKLGLLGASVAADVIMVYSKANMGADPEKMPEADGAILSKIMDGAAEIHLEWMQDIAHVCERLKSVEFDTPDPGILVEARQARNKAEGGRPS